MLRQRDFAASTRATIISDHLGWEHTTRPSGRRYAYYVSQALLQNSKDRSGSVPRVRAEEIERLVATAGDGEQGARQSRPIERVVVHKTGSRSSPAASDKEEGATEVVPAKLAHRNRAKV
jgi:site-specific DNA recombinase